MFFFVSHNFLVSFQGYIFFLTAIILIQKQLVIIYNFSSKRFKKTDLKKITLPIFALDFFRGKQKTKQKTTKKICYISFVTKTEVSQNWNVTKTKMSPKLKSHQRWNVIKTEMSPKLKCYQNWNITKSKNVIKIEMKLKKKLMWSALISLVLFSTFDG